MEVVELAGTRFDDGSGVVETRLARSAAIAYTHVTWSSLPKELAGWMASLSFCMSLAISWESVGYRCGCLSFLRSFVCGAGHVGSLEY